MPSKRKIPSEQKVKAVETYLSGEKSQQNIAREIGIHHTTLQDWIRIYKTTGSEGFNTKANNQHYSKGLKLQVVTEYLTERVSLQDLCYKYNISQRNMVLSWVKKYNSHEEFRSPNSGGGIRMAKGHTTTLEERIEIIRFCIENGRDYGKTIERYAVSYQQIYNWMRKYEEYGAAGLIDRRGKKKDEAAMSDLDKLKTEKKLLEAEVNRMKMEVDLLKKLEEVERRRYSVGFGKKANT